MLFCVRLPVCLCLLCSLLEYSSPHCTYLLTRLSNQSTMCSPLSRHSRALQSVLMGKGQSALPRQPGVYEREKEVLLLRFSALYCTLLYCIVLYSCVMLYYVMLCYVMLCYAQFHSDSIKLYLLHYILE